MPVLRVDAAQTLIRPAKVRLHGDPAGGWRRFDTWRFGTWSWRVFALLLVCIVAVALYAWMRPSATVSPVPTLAGVTATRAAAAPAVPAETAEQKRERRRLRRLAQDALQPIEVQRKALASLHPQYWNPAGIAAADQLLHQSERAYLAESYVAAADGYRATYAAYVSLIAQGRALRAGALVAARQAIDNAQIEPATKALYTAQRINTGADATALARRLRVLPTVLAQVDRGIAARAIEDLEMAHVAFSEALRLDPATHRARSELAQVDQLRAKQRFMSVMNRGFSALQQQQFDAARATFQQASAYQPGGVTTAVALQEVSATSLVDELQRLQVQADALLRGEQFNAAAEAYRKALAKDPSLTFAQQGIAHALTRGDARRQIDDALAHPERLSSDEVLAASQRLLEKAQALQGVGPQLAERRRELETVLKAATRNVTVELRSDNLTELRVFRIGAIGRVTSHRLALRPGRYTIIGTRDGYRDIRQDIDVHAGMSPIDVRCREPI